MSMIRTSDTHPLRIDAVAVPSGTGFIGMTFCPGKKQPVAMTGAWDRDVAKDVATICAWGGSTLVSLIEAHEFIELQVTELPKACVDYGLAWHGLPVVDGSIPDARWEADWKTISPSLYQTLRANGRIVIHCKGGLGRTGLLAARILIDFGLPNVEALTQVRKARPGAIETLEQKRYVLAYTMEPSQ